jgi:phosphate transport system substrate-binding protein
MQKISFILISLLFFIACRQKTKTSTDTYTSGEIWLACAENFQNIISAEIDVFGVHYPLAKVQPIYLSEGSAIQMLIDDSVKIAVTARDLTAAERQKITNNRIIRKYTFAFEGIAIVANKANKDTSLSLSALKQILKGEITDWKQINPNSTLGGIKVLFDSKETSVLNYLVDSITQTNENLSPNLYAMKSISNLRDKIAELPSAIGIVGLNQIGNETTKTYKEFMSKTRFMQIDNSLPYAGDLHNGDYPLWRPIYVLLGETRNGLPKGFCFFLTQEIGQKIILKAGLMPISDPQNTYIQIN